MSKLSRCLLAVSIAAVMSLGLAACGDDDDDGGGGSTGSGSSGGELTIAYTSQPDYMDPALSYTVEGWNVLWTVYTPPYSYKHEEGAEGAKLVPALAEAMPEISPDGKTYTFKFRKGLKFTDGTPLKASDFEHTVKRILNLESGGAPFYEIIKGAEEYEAAGDPDADISGITPNDQTGEVKIELKEAQGAFTYVLALNFSGVVPSGTPFKNLSKDPPPGIGQFKITKSIPNRETVVEKNADFDLPGLPQAKVDKINIKIIGDQRRQTQDVIQGKLDYIVDPPPADLLPEVKQKYSDRYEEQVTNSTYYFWLNTKVPPFDNQKVREAVGIGLDKTALARLFGGLLEPACNFLPPGMVGYEKIEDCPHGDPLSGGDKAAAKKILEAEGVAGDPITVWGNDEDPTQKVTENFADQLSEMGFDAKPKIVAGSVYFQTIGNEKTPDLHAGFANWFQDFPHPSNFMFLVNGDTIQPTNNQNYSNLDDPEITKEINRLDAETDLEAVASDWAAVDKAVVDSHAVIPYGHRKLVTFMSERMDFENCSLYHAVYNDDLTSFCLKK
jgi:peptide/nickel transport system substrate-binding protein